MKMLLQLKFQKLCYRQRHQNAYLLRQGQEKERRSEKANSQDGVRRRTKERRITRKRRKRNLKRWRQLSTPKQLLRKLGLLQQRQRELLKYKKRCKPHQKRKFDLRQNPIIVWK